MSRCSECNITVEGAWARCPLCSAELGGSRTATPNPSPSPLPTAPLEFSRRRVLQVLFFASLGIIVLSLAAQLLFSRDNDGIGLWRSIWLGLTAMWLVVIMAVRKRHNIAKGVVYFVLISGLVCVYWDYLTGWHGWALTYAVPSVCAASIVALLITASVMRAEIGDYIIYSVLTVALGLVPFVFATLGWLNDPLVAVICGVLSVAVLAMLQLWRGREMRHELAKRLHV